MEYRRSPVSVMTATGSGERAVSPLRQAEIMWYPAADGGHDPRGQQRRKRFETSSCGLSLTVHPVLIKLNPSLSLLCPDLVNSQKDNNCNTRLTKSKIFA
jgi:hypothetical protein